MTSKAGTSAVPSPDDTSEARRILLGHTVFNADQIDNLLLNFFVEPDAEPVPLSSTSKGEEEARLSALFARLPVTLRYGGNRTFSSKAADVI